jgi:hypothetical protein
VGLAHVNLKGTNDATSCPHNLLDCTLLFLEVSFFPTNLSFLSAGCPLETATRSPRAVEKYEAHFGYSIFHFKRPHGFQ